MDLASLLMRQYGLDAEAATELAAMGEKIMEKTFQSFPTMSASASANAAFDESEFPPTVSTDDLKRSFDKQGFSKLFNTKARMPSILKVAGDGNCLLTTLALSLELEGAVDIAIKAAAENRLPLEEEGVPELSGEEGGDPWKDGVQIRKWIVSFYGPDRLHRELPATFGNITFEEEENGVKVLKSRRMTRCDLLCVESQFSNVRDVDMSNSPQAFAKREQIAKAYMDSIKEHGSWCSAPTIVAFALARKVKKPIRVYLLNMGTLSVYADTVPDGCLPLPPPQEDELLCDFENAKFPFGMYDATLSDFEQADLSAVGAGAGAQAEAEQEDEDDPHDAQQQEEEEEEKQEFCEDFTRIIFRPGHYELAVTASQRAKILKFWPHMERLFSPFPENVVVKFPV